MKKIIALTLVLLMCLLLFASCGGKEDGDGKNDAEKTEEQTADETTAPDGETAGQPTDDEKTTQESQTSPAVDEVTAAYENGVFTAAGIAFPIPAGFTVSPRAEIRYFFGDNSDNVYGFRQTDDAGNTVNTVLFRLYGAEAKAQFDSFSKESILKYYQTNEPEQSPSVDDYQEGKIGGLNARFANISMKDSVRIVFCFMNMEQCVLAEYNVNANATDADVAAMRAAWTAIAPADGNGQEPAPQADGTGVTVDGIVIPIPDGFTKQTYNGEPIYVKPDPTGENLNAIYIQQIERSVFDDMDEDSLLEAYREEFPDMELSVQGYRTAELSGLPAKLIGLSLGENCLVVGVYIQTAQSCVGVEYTAFDADTYNEMYASIEAIALAE